MYYFQNGAPVGAGQVASPSRRRSTSFTPAWRTSGDYSFFGFTGAPGRIPLPAGGWGRTTGSLFFLTLAADARGYLFLKPFGFAVRAMTGGRCLGGSDNAALSDYYLGDPGLVRGYEYYSMISNEGAAGNANIPQINRLFGSRIAVVKAELRLPVLGNADIGLFNFPYLPATLVGFFDGGIAWTGSEMPGAQPGPPTVLPASPSSARGRR